MVENLLRDSLHRDHEDRSWSHLSDGDAPRSEIGYSFRLGRLLLMSYPPSGSLRSLRHLDSLTSKMFVRTHYVRVDRRVSGRIQVSCSLRSVEVEMITTIISPTSHLSRSKNGTRYAHLASRRIASLGYATLTLTSESSVIPFFSLVLRSGRS